MAERSHVLVCRRSHRLAALNRLLEQDTGFVACVLDAIGDMQLEPGLQVRQAPGVQRVTRPAMWRGPCT